MASPESAKTLPPVAPAAPAEAEPADNADPGEVEKAKAEQREGQFGKYGKTPVEYHTGSAGPDAAGDAFENGPEPVTWIEIELVDTTDKPVSGEGYEVKLPDGKVACGTLDEKGFARIDGIPPGTCQVSFPRLDKDAWKKA